MHGSDGESGGAMTRREKFERRFYERLTLVKAIHAIAFVIIVLTLGAAFLERLFEPQTFTNYGDACWWAVATVSTTGFGDLVPHTVAGRLIAGFTMIVSLAWVPAMTAIVITLLVRKRDEQDPIGHAVSHEVVVLEQILERLERLQHQVAPAATDREPREFRESRRYRRCERVSPTGITTAQAETAT